MEGETTKTAKGEIFLIQGAGRLAHKGLDTGELFHGEGESGVMELMVVDEGEGDETDGDSGEHDGDGPRKEGAVH